MQPFTGEDRSLWKRWPPRRRRKAKAYRGGIRVQRYLFPLPAWLLPSSVKAHTKRPLSSSPRSTAPSFLHVNPLARIQCMYIRTYIYIYIPVESFEAILTQKYGNFLFESLELFSYEFSWWKNSIQWPSTTVNGQLTKVLTSALRWLLTSNENCRFVEAI